MPGGHSSKYTPGHLRLAFKHPQVSPVNDGGNEVSAKLRPLEVIYRTHVLPCFSASIDEVGFEKDTRLFPCGVKCGEIDDSPIPLPLELETPIERHFPARLHYTAIFQ